MTTQFPLIRILQCATVPLWQDAAPNRRRQESEAVLNTKGGTVKADDHETAALKYDRARSVAKKEAGRSRRPAWLPPAAITETAG